MKTDETVNVLLINTSGNTAQVVKIFRKSYVALNHKQESLTALKAQRALTPLEELELLHASEVLLGAKIAEGNPAVSALAAKCSFDLGNAYNLLSQADKQR